MLDRGELRVCRVVDRTVMPPLGRRAARRSPPVIVRPPVALAVRGPSHSVCGPGPLSTWTSSPSGLPRSRSRRHCPIRSRHPRCRAGRPAGRCDRDRGPPASEASPPCGAGPVIRSPASVIAPLPALSDRSPGLSMSSLRVGSPMPGAVSRRSGVVIGRLLGCAGAGPARLTTSTRAYPSPVEDPALSGSPASRAPRFASGTRCTRRATRPGGWTPKVVGEPGLEPGTSGI